MTKSDDRQWWGRQNVGTNNRLLWQIGALDLWLSCLPNEWRVTSVEAPDRLRMALRRELPAT